MTDLFDFQLNYKSSFCPAIIYDQYIPEDLSLEICGMRVTYTSHNQAPDTEFMRISSSLAARKMILGDIGKLWVS